MGTRAGRTWAARSLVVSLYLLPLPVWTPAPASAAPTPPLVFGVNENSNTVAPFPVGAVAPNPGIAVGSSPTAVAITPDGNKAYVTILSSSSVSVIDVATAAVVGTIPVGSVP